MTTDGDRQQQWASDARREAVEHMSERQTTDLLTEVIETVDKARQGIPGQVFVVRDPPMTDGADVSISGERLGRFIDTLVDDLTQHAHLKHGHLTRTWMTCPHRFCEDVRREYLR